MEAFSILKPLAALVKYVLSIFEYMRNYFYLKKAEPMKFTIGTKSNVGSTLFTTGRVISINLLTAEIEGYQVNDPVTTNGIFKIRLHKIVGINRHGGINSNS